MKGRGAKARHPRLRRRLCWAEHGAAGEDRWAGRDRTWALCDGATEGYDGAGWAACLARQLASGAAAERALRRARQVYAPAFRPSRGGEGWLAEHAVRRGSWATALRVRVLPAAVEVLARGDTVFFLRDGLQTRASFPLDDPEAFDNQPNLLADRDNGAESGSDNETAFGVALFQRALFDLRPLRRPLLVLATDALAQRILRSQDAERRRLWAFLDRCSAAEFASWAQKETAAGTLRRDDLTLLELTP